MVLTQQAAAASVSRAAELEAARAAAAEAERTLKQASALLVP